VPEAPNFPKRKAKAAQVLRKEKKNFFYVRVCIISRFGIMPETGGGNGIADYVRI
jgi:hypothetical protein